MSKGRGKEMEQNSECVMSERGVIHLKDWLRKVRACVCMCVPVIAFEKECMKCNVFENVSVCSYVFVCER